MMPAKLLGTLGLVLALAGCGLGGPAQPLFTVKGAVTDDAGRPVAGAVVSDGQVSTLSDEDGRFTLAIYAEKLSFVKPGHARVTRTAKKGEAIDASLKPSSLSLRVGFDTRAPQAELAGLKAVLSEGADKLASYPTTSLGDLDVLVMLTPGALGGSELKRLADWVQDGGRLIVCGEWGGFPEQSLTVLNQLANPAGISFTGATVKVSDGEDGEEALASISRIAVPSVAKMAGADTVHMFTTTSLALTGSARALLQSDRQAYSVLARTGPQVLGAVGASGLGKVFALADSSLWLDEDSEGLGKPNLTQGANAKLPSALLKW